ncbi:hypothetical protein HN51_008499 [Arachis hypogaea]|uniref:Uncharacterized protein n=1 Tax=Arachis hypogaea TaxID=3818 RepID=A0A445D3G2_ARAHY|nr:venom phosphodiesterase 2 [Arachis hypogaea]QHO42815.1 Venom phosphodiesterase [Arachis hypogaea]RYR57671.1 hypothetical protein Ahy_A05g023369 [Arachis hypogaea]
MQVDPTPPPSTAPLLPLSPRSSSTTTARRRPLVFTSLLTTTCISISAALAFAFLFFTSATSSATPPPHPHSRPLKKLHHPTVILISSDGFRFGYHLKSPNLPTLRRLISNGTSASAGLVPVFPSLTFPNHYSIVTGLYPPYHGIINNYFYDPITNEKFTMTSHEPKWWLGHPLWETVVSNGLKAATYFWPGSEVVKGQWNCPVNFCAHYNESVPFDDRVDTVLGYFDLPIDEIPSFITLYFEDPDHQGHQVGPDDPRITRAVENIDRVLGRLVKGLEKRGVFDDVSLVLVGDHGMVGTCDKKIVALADLSPWVEIPADWVHSLTPLLAIKPPEGVDPAGVVAKMNQGLSSGKVENGEFLKVYLKEDLPKRLHYAASDRIPPIIGLLEEGFTIEMKRSSAKECAGAHGYDNAFLSMRTIFIAHGPQFERGRLIPSFENVQIYNLVTSILNIKGASNNGSASFPESVLLPPAPSAM